MVPQMFRAPSVLLSGKTLKTQHVQHTHGPSPVSAQCYLQPIAPNPLDHPQASREARSR